MNFGNGSNHQALYSYDSYILHSDKDWNIMQSVFFWKLEYNKITSESLQLNALNLVWWQIMNISPNLMITVFYVENY